MLFSSFVKLVIYEFLLDIYAGAGCTERVVLIRSVGYSFISILATWHTHIPTKKDKTKEKVTMRSATTKVTTDSTSGSPAATLTGDSTKNNNSSGVAIELKPPRYI